MVKVVVGVEVAGRVDARRHCRHILAVNIGAQTMRLLGMISASGRPLLAVIVTSVRVVKLGATVMKPFGMRSACGIPALVAGARSAAPLDPLDPSV